MKYPCKKEEEEKTNRKRMQFPVSTQAFIESSTISGPWRTPHLQDQHQGQLQCFLFNFQCNQQRRVDSVNFQFMKYKHLWLCILSYEIDLLAISNTLSSCCYVVHYIQVSLNKMNWILMLHIAGQTVFAFFHVLINFKPSQVSVL